MTRDTLSRRMYFVLRIFCELGFNEYMTIEEAQAIDQRPFRAMLLRQYVVFRAGRGFHVTKEGREAWHVFNHSEAWRKNPTLPLTAYFDASAYGLAPQRERKTRAQTSAA